MIKPQDPVANLLDGMEVVGNKNRGCPSFDELDQDLFRFSLKSLVAYGKDLIDDQNLGVGMDRHGKSKPEIHPVGVSPYGEGP